MLRKQNAFTSQFSTEAEKTLGAGLFKFDQLIAEGVAPMEARTQVQAEANDSASLIMSTFPDLRFGSKDNLDGAEGQLLQAVDEGRIGSAEAEKQAQLIESMRSAKDFSL